MSPVLAGAVQGLHKPGGGPAHGEVRGARRGEHHFAHDLEGVIALLDVGAQKPGPRPSIPVGTPVEGKERHRQQGADGSGDRLRVRSVAKEVVPEVVPEAKRDIRDLDVEQEVPSVVSMAKRAVPRKSAVTWSMLPPAMKFSTAWPRTAIGLPQAAVRLGNATSRRNPAGVT